MDGEVKVAINYDRVADDSKWDGLKGYLTNTDIPIQDVYTAYHNLWHVERAFRIAKSKIEILPCFTLHANVLKLIYASASSL